MPIETQIDLPRPMAYVTREDARNLEAGIADCILMMREQTGRFERPVYARPEKTGSAVKGFGCPVPTAAERAGRIYVAGPMSGIPDFNFPVFNAAAAMLRETGWTVENPAEHSLADNLEWSDYMAYDLTRLGLCGAIYMLPGWSKSKGATIEKNLAEALGMNIQFDPNAEQALDVAPVPPAGGEVEVIGYRINTETPAVSGYTLTLNPVAEGKYQVPVADYAHVTRLQAEVSYFTGTVRQLASDNADLQSELTKARELLTEVVDGTGSSPGANKRYGKIRAYLDGVPTCKACKGSGKEYDGAAHTCTVCNGSGVARQSAPAAKGGSDE
ncbi:DUF4406 domain-containing protein [Pseudomonas abietaniphila]